MEIKRGNGLLYVKQDFYEGISHPRNSTLMRVFLNMGLTEHTGHGVPIIIKKYGKEAFEITDNYIKCRIPYDEKVLDMSKKNVGINKTEKAVPGILISNPDKTAEEIAVEVGVTKRTIERTLVSLKKKGLIERIGSNKSGSWYVVQ